MASFLDFPFWFLHLACAVFANEQERNDVMFSFFPFSRFPMVHLLHLLLPRKFDELVYNAELY
jgi:hypothetical protein